jgi:hypothetical protein
MITEEIKIRGIQHIAYEMQMMFHCVEHLQILNQTPNNNPEKSFQHNLTLEGVLIHLRSLKEFFEKGPDNPDHRDLNIVHKPCDIFAVDYGFPQSPIPFPASMNNRVNREVSHLTYFRINSVEKPWTDRETTEVIKPFCTKFLIHVLNKYRGIDELESQYQKDGWLDYTAYHCITELKTRFGLVL